MGREQAADLCYLACFKIQNIKDAQALLYMGRLGLVSIYVEECYISQAEGQEDYSWADGTALVVVVTR